MGGVERRRVRGRESEEVFDEPLQPHRVVEDVALGHLPVRLLRVREVDLELRADAGQRAPQLVAGVGDETALPLGGVLEPSEHGVHGARQSADLVLGAGFGDATVEVLRADLLHLASHRLDRAQSAARHHPRDRAHEQEQRRQSEREEADQARCALVDPLQRAGDVDGVRALARDDAPRDDPERTVAIGDLDLAAGCVPARTRVQRADARPTPQVRRCRDDTALGVDDLHQVLVAPGHGQHDGEVAVGDGRRRCRASGAGRRCRRSGSANAAGPGPATHRRRRGRCRRPGPPPG